MSPTSSAVPTPQPSNSLEAEASLNAPEIGVDRRARAKAQRAALMRAASKRRRFVDPATCERDYTAAELEFMKAIEAHKKRTGRSFPSWGEVLGVIRDLGYEKLRVEGAGR
jgi:hypothetical protein